MLLGKLSDITVISNKLLCLEMMVHISPMSAFDINKKYIHKPFSATFMCFNSQILIKNTTIIGTVQSDKDQHYPVGTEECLDSLDN